MLLRQKCLFAGLIAILALTLAGCDYQKPELLRVGTNLWPGYEPLYMAREKGYLHKDKVHLVEYSSASQVLQAYRNGVIDGAALTLDEVTLLLETGEKPKIILVTDISHGGDVIIGQPGIKNLDQLKNRNVGIEATALGAYVITRAMETSNLSSDDIHIIHKNADEHEASFLKKEVDAIVTFEPVRSKLLAAGGNPLFDSSMIPGEIVDVIVIREEFINHHSDNIQHLVNAWFDALNEIRTNPRESAKILGQRMKLSVDETLSAFDGIKLPGIHENRRLLLSRPSPVLSSTAENMAKMMVQKKLLKKPVDVNQLFLNHEYFNAAE